MKIEKWALLAEILSAVAVVVTLIFVGLQVRQGAEETAFNTRAIEVSAYQDLTAQIADLNTLQIENPQLAAARGRAVQGFGPETDEERLILEAYFRMAFRHGDMAFRQYDAGLIDEETLSGMLAPVIGYMRTDVGADLWSSMSSLNAKYKAYVNKVAGN